MKCPNCNGVRDDYNHSQCSFCCGKPELDWIEYIFGVERHQYYKEMIIDLERKKRLFRKKRYEMP